MQPYQYRHRHLVAFPIWSFAFPQHVASHFYSRLLSRLCVVCSWMGADHTPWLASIGGKVICLVSSNRVIWTLPNCNFVIVSFSLIIGVSHCCNIISWRCERVADLCWVVTFNFCETKIYMKLGYNNLYIFSGFLYCFLQFLLPAIVHINHQPYLQKGDGPIVSTAYKINKS